MMALAFRVLPFAGIIQIRFKGISHPAAHCETIAKLARTPSRYSCSRQGAGSVTTSANYTRIRTDVGMRLIYNA